MPDTELQAKLAHGAVIARATPASRDEQATRQKAAITAHRTWGEQIWLMRLPRHRRRRPR